MEETFNGAHVLTEYTAGGSNTSVPSTKSGKGLPHSRTRAGAAAIADPIYSHWALCRSAWSTSTSAVIASTIGTARGSTQGS